MASLITRETLASALLNIFAPLSLALHYYCVSHFLSPGTSGTWILLISFVALCGLAESGLGYDFIIYQSKNFLNKSYPSFSLLATYAKLFRFRASIGAICFFAGYCLLWLTMRLHGVHGHLLIAFALALVTYLNVNASFYYSYLSASGYLYLEKTLRLFNAVCFVSFSYVGLLISPSPLGLSTSFLLSCIASRLILIVVYRRHSRPIIICADLSSVSFDVDINSKAINKRSIRLFASQASGQVVQNSDTITGGVLQLQDQILGYSALQKAISFIALLSTSKLNGIFPIFSHSQGSQDFSRPTRILLLQVIVVSTILALALSSLLLIAYPAILALWLPSLSAYPSVEILIVLLVATCLEIHHLAFANVMLASGRRTYVRSAFLAASSNIVLSILLGLKFGFLGIAAATLLSQLIFSNIYIPLDSLSALKIHAGKYFFFVFSLVAFAVLLLIFVFQVAKAASTFFCIFLGICLGGNYLCLAVYAIAISLLLLCSLKPLANLLSEHALRWTSVD